MLSSLQSNPEKKMPTETHSLFPLLSLIWTEGP